MVDTSVPHRRAIMINKTVENYPSFPLPDGFVISGYKAGLERAWAEIEVEQQGNEIVVSGIRRGVAKIVYRLN